MRIILVRHGISEDYRIGSAKTDAERSLTTAGRQEMARVADALHRLAGDVDCVGSSPFLRARQTADLLLTAYDKGTRPELQVVEALKSGATAEAMTEWLAGNDPDSTVVVVGHEPDLSVLMGYLTTVDSSRYAAFQPAGAALIECAATPGLSGGKLRWLTTPEILIDAEAIDAG